MLSSFSPEETRMLWEFSTTIGTAYLGWFLYLTIITLMDRNRKDNQ